MRQSGFMNPRSRIQVLSPESLVYDEGPLLSSDSQKDSEPIKGKNADLIPSPHLTDGDTQVLKGK